MRLDARFHGKLPSSQSVAAKTASEKSVPDAWKPMMPAERATSRMSGAESPLRADVSAPGSSARSVGFSSPVSMTSKRSERTISTRWCAPRALVSSPRSGLRARLRTRLARSAVGLPEMPAHSVPAHSCASTRRIAVNVERCSGSGPGGSTTESRISPATRVGWRAA